MMLGVLLTVLKIIGIIILVLIGLLLLLVLLALFVPIRYKLQGAYYEELRGEVKVHWLCRIVWMRYFFTLEDSYFVVRIFGFKIISTKVDTEEVVEEAKDQIKEQVKDVGKAAENVAEEEARDQFAGFEEKKNDTTLEHKIDKTEDRIIGLEKEKKIVSDDKNLVENSTNENENGNTETKVTGNKINETEKKINETEKKIKKLWIKIKLFFTKIKSFILKTIEFFKNIKDRIKIIYANVIDQSNREAVKLVYETTKKLLKHIKPRKGWLRLKYGMEDPATTGYILGVASIATVGFGRRVQIEPDFQAEETFFQGKGCFKGRIYLIVLLLYSIKLYRNKKLKLLISRFNKGGKENG